MKAITLLRSPIFTRNAFRFCSTTTTATASTTTTTTETPSAKVLLRRARKEKFAMDDLKLEKHEKEALEKKLPWRIVTSTIVERSFIVTPDLEPWEEDFFNLQLELSKYAKVYPPETGFMVEDPNEPQTYQELLDSLPFEPGPRITEDDKTNNRHSFERKLSERLYLLVKKKSTGSDNGWHFPQRIRREGETMRMSSERTLARECGTELHTHFPSNAPVGFFYNVFSEDAQREKKVYGDKIFFYWAYIIDCYKSGNVKLSPKLEDYNWVTKNEFSEYFLDKNYHDFIQRIT